MAEQYKDPWTDAANQAVGALYKYYLTKPTAADALKAQTEQAQLEHLQLQNRTDTTANSMGNFTVPNLSPEIRNDLYRRSVEGRGEGDAAKLFGTYVNKPMQVDAGDAKYIVDGSTGMPIQQYGVGTAPKVEIDTTGGQVIRTPGVAALNRPAMPVAGGPVTSGRQNIMAMAEQAGVNPVLADGVHGAESSYGANNGPSSAGAVGPMQTMPDTLKDPGYGVQPAQDPNNPHEQARVGVDYLAAMVNRYQGDEEAALIAYNAGPANADKWLQSGRNYAALPKPQETQSYVQTVMGAQTDGQGASAVQSQAPSGQPQMPMGQPAAQQQPTTMQDGTVITALPKSPAAQAKENEKNRLKGISSDVVNDETRRALNMLNEKGGSVAGVVGSMTKDIPMLPAHDFSKMLETVKANIGFDKLQSMRDASPTGGALGQVSTFENELLQAVFGSLAQSQSPEQLRYNLMRLQNTYNDIIHGKEQGPTRYEIPTPDTIGQMNNPQQLQGVLEFFKYDPPSDIKQMVIQRANQLGL